MEWELIPPRHKLLIQERVHFLATIGTHRCLPSRITEGFEHFRAICLPGLNRSIHPRGEEILALLHSVVCQSLDGNLLQVASQHTLITGSYSFLDAQQKYFRLTPKA